MENTISMETPLTISFRKKKTYLGFILCRRLCLLFKKERIFCQCSRCGAYYIASFNRSVNKILTEKEVTELMNAQGWDVIPGLSVHCKDCASEGGTQ